MPKVSLAIPYHDKPEMAASLSRLLGSIATQTYTNYEIVLTREGAFARNHNAAIQKSTGEIIQFLQSDDYFATPFSLERIVNSFKGEWMITACLHDNGKEIGNPHQPEWTDDIYTGNNRLGSVSTLSMLREKALLFEEPLSWVVDCDLYYRLFLKYGYPQLNTDYGVVVNTKHGRLTDTITSIDKQQEHEYLIRKYA